MISELLKRILPAKLVSLIRQRRWNARYLGTRQTVGGLRVRVESFPDWIIYHELFEQGQYDETIGRTLSEVPPQQPLVVLDLGANVGYFILRFADLLRQSPHPGRPWQIVAIEGDPSTFGELQRRVAEQPEVRNHVQLHHGLVGRRSGVGQMVRNAEHFASRISEDIHSSGQPTEFVDVAVFLSGYERISLLKCDIEGAEDEFLRNYPDLLQKVDRICIEIHSRAKRDACLPLLNAAGLSKIIAVEEQPDGTDMRFVYLITRDEPDS